MLQIAKERRGVRASALGLALVVALAAVPGCGGEPELPVVESEKNREQLQKDMENPYGAPVKAPKTKKADTTGKD